ncbi:MAG: hypothetical protein U0587_18450 [Candidatus Binatia bacterium]
MRTLTELPATLSANRDLMGPQDAHYPEREMEVENGWTVWLEA